MALIFVKVWVWLLVFASGSGPRGAARRRQPLQAWSKPPALGGSLGVPTGDPWRVLVMVGTGDSETQLPKHTSLGNGDRPPRGWGSQCHQCPHAELGAVGGGGHCALGN